MSSCFISGNLQVECAPVQQEAVFKELADFGATGGFPLFYEPETNKAGDAVIKAELHGDELWSSFADDLGELFEGLCNKFTIRIKGYLIEEGDDGQARVEYGSLNGKLDREYSGWLVNCPNELNRELQLTYKRMMRNKKNITE